MILSQRHALLTHYVHQGQFSTSVKMKPILNFQDVKGNLITILERDRLITTHQFHPYQTSHRHHQHPSTTRSEWTRHSWRFLPKHHDSPS